MTSCPVCNKPVDPIRARFVAVRAGKVVAYCSPECRQVEETKPTKVEGTPKPAIDLDSGPVIEILHEPASGVVTSARDERITGQVPKQELVIEESKPRKDGSKTSGGADQAAVSGEVIEPKRAPTRPSGKHLTRDRKDSTEARAGWDWLDDEPAEHARPGSYTESERRARWPLVVLLLLVADGGAGYYVWKYVLERDKGATASTVVAPPPVVVDAEVPADAALTAADAIARAQAVLRNYVADGTPQLQRLAAGALGRTGDPAAIVVLQQGVKAEKVPAARFTLAYELARARDRAGVDALVAGLAAPNRSDKLDAAAKLAQLGEDRARPLLTSLLGVAQHRLQAAQQLARLKDPAAEKLLEQVRTDPTSSTDEKATATIALFRAGKRELVDDVKQLLEHESWKSPAAYALGRAGDAAVKSLLIEQLQGVGVKVKAAYALRPLVGDELDRVLLPLHAQLASLKDREQIAAAEAILILAGPPEWATHP